MDHRVILAVAGSGKTTHIINSIDTSKSNLILTYTENNYRNLRNRIVQEYNGISDNTRIYTYFSFLYSFCLRPLCGDQYELKGINFDNPPEYTQRLKRNNLRYYIDSHNRIYSSRIASFINKFNMINEVKARIEKYCDCLYVDEVQDFAGSDFNFLISIATGNFDSVLVGDFFQHTYDTSRDGNVNKRLHIDFDSYKSRLIESGFILDENSLSHSYRCRITTCEFVTNMLGIPIQSHCSEESQWQFVDDEALADSIFYQDQTVKLFYQSHRNYPCFSENWGASKGLDNFDSVCVVLNKKTEDFFRNGKLKQLPPMTKNKLYVACTRARSELFFIPERYFKKYKP